MHAELSGLDFEAFDNYAVLDLFFRRWAQVAPEAAVDAALRDAGPDGFGFRAAIKAWAERDALAALARTEKLNFDGIKRLREQLGAMGLPKPGQFSPEEALRLIRERRAVAGLGNDLTNATGDIFSEWAKTDPAAAWKAALALPGGESDSWMRRFVIGRVVRESISTDPKIVTQWIDALPVGPARTEVQKAYVSALASDHARLATAYALALPDGPERREIMGTVASALSQNGRKMDAAAAFMESLPPADWQDPTAFRQVIRDWLNLQPERAAGVLLANIPPDIQPTEKDREAYSEMFTYWSATQPQAFSEFVLKLPEGLRGSAITSAMANWCYKDAAAAGQWAVALPSGPTRDQALEQIAVSLTGRGAGEVTHWLDTLPADSGRAAAVEGFARTVMSVSPDDALAWLHSVPDETDRLARLRRVWQSWADRAAAQRWLEASTDLTDTERAALRR